MTTSTMPAPSSSQEIAKANIYVPDGVCPPSRHSTIRALIMGAPKTGKTWSALTFPNPLVLDFDNNIPRAHPNWDNIKTIPFWDPKYCVEIIGMQISEFTGQPCRYMALHKWLAKHAKKLTEDQTLITDSITYLGDNFDTWWENHPKLSLTKGGDIDKWKRWNQKIIAFDEIHESLASLKCNVVGIIHERPDYDNDGNINGIKPILTGAYSDRLAGRYNECFRQQVKYNKETNKREYIWTIKSDGRAHAGGNIVSILPEGTNSIEAGYESIRKILEGTGGKV